MGEIGDAEVVIVGGGAIGCAVAYRLAEAGVSDVLLVEKNPALAAGTTAQAAGLVGQVRSAPERVRLAMDSVATFSRLQGHDGATPNWRQVGSLRIALTDARVDEFHRLRATARAAGLEVELLDHAAAQARWPGLVTQLAKAILWCPTDGYLQPYDLTMAYRDHARTTGVRFATDVRVTGIVRRGGAVAAVETDRGRVRCAKVIVAAGAHAYHAAHLAGVELPIVPVRHEYFITVPIGGLRPDLPTFRVPDATLYGRPDVNALLLGGWEPRALSCDPRAYELSGEPPAIEPDWPVLASFGEQMASALPAYRRCRYPARVPRLADLHAGRPLHSRREPARPRPSHGWGLQCSRRLRLRRHRTPRGRGAARAEALCLCPEPEPRPLHRDRLGLG